MRNLYMILNKLSIHGLPYLTPQHHGMLGRLIWLLCVLVSFSLAGLVIWSNVDSWRSQPTVVAGVEYSLIEDQPWMPQVIVCPTSLNSFAMLNGLLKATNNKALTPEMLPELRLSLTKMIIMERYYQSSRAEIYMYQIQNLDLSPYERCFEIEDYISDDCSLILVLAALLDKFSFHKSEELIVKYTAESIINQNSANIYDYMFENHNISKADILDVSPSLLTSYRGVLVLYMTFFDVLDIKKVDIIGPQPLILYIKDFPQIDVPHESKINNFLSWILKGYSIVRPRRIDSKYYNPIQELSGFLSAIWLGSLKAYLKVESNEDAILLMNSFWHGGLNTSLFQPFKNRTNKGYMCNNLLTYNEFNDLCKGDNRQRLVEPECDKYCKLLTNLSSETQTRIKEVLKMGFDGDIPATSSFQSCHHPTRGFFKANECWKRVINDRGICYSSKGNGALTNRVPGVMKDAPITFLLDEGQHMEISEDSPDSYKLESLELSTNPRKVYCNVVSYYQTSVESTLYEEEEIEGVGVKEPFPISRETHHELYYAEDPIIRMGTYIEYIHNSTDAFKAMNPMQKNCYLPKYEKKLNHFDEYSEADCFLECSWEIAIKRCLCVPWYIGDIYPGVNLCEIFGNRCFQNIVSSRYKKESLTKKQCEPSCLPNCDMIQYSTKKTIGDALINTDLVKNYFSLKAETIPVEVLELADNNTKIFSKKSNLFALELRLTNKKLAQKIVRTATMTTTDLISNVGGTLGLFCGLSVLSLVEILYWTGRVAFGVVHNKEKRSKKKNYSLRRVAHIFP